MRLSASHEIQAPIDFVFPRFCDFARLESFANTTKREIKRIDGGTELAEGLAYRMNGKFGGKQRDLEITLATYLPTERLKYECGIETMTATLRLDFEKMADELTRVDLSIDPVAHSISSRLALQSIKIAKGTIERRMETRLFHFGNEIMQDYRGG